MLQDQLKILNIKNGEAENEFLITLYILPPMNLIKFLVKYFMKNKKKALLATNADPASVQQRVTQNEKLILFKHLI